MKLSQLSFALGLAGFLMACNGPVTVDTSTDTDTDADADTDSDTDTDTDSDTDADTDSDTDTDVDSCAADETLALDVGDSATLQFDTSTETDNAFMSCEDGTGGAADRIYRIDVASTGNLVVNPDNDWHVWGLFDATSDCSSGDVCYDPFVEGFTGIYADVTPGTYYLVVSDWSAASSLAGNAVVTLYGIDDEICTDGTDQDSDGLIDCDDDGCGASGFCTPEDCVTAGDEDFDFTEDCNDLDCVGTSACTGGVCDADVDLGVLDASQTYTVTDDPSAGDDDVDLTCAGTGGLNDTVIQFSVEYPALVNVDFDQAADGLNNFGFYYEGAPGGSCVDQEGFCFEPPAQVAGLLTTAALPAGNYWMVIEANPAGGTFDLAVDVTLQCPDGLHIDTDLGTCVFDTCDDLDCASQNKDCDDSPEPSVCSDCLGGFTLGYNDRCYDDALTYGSECEQSSDCPGTGEADIDVLCLGSTGGFCLTSDAPECTTAGQPCTDDPDSVCVQNASTATMICAPACATDDDCRAGYWCNPDAYGSVGQAACEVIDDCATMGCNDGTAGGYYCDDPDFLDDTYCFVDSCGADPCAGDSNSDGTCNSIGDDYSCDCNTDYVWNGEDLVCELFECRNDDLGTWDGTPITVTGNTCDDGDTRYGNASLSCTGWSAGGSELTYELVVPDGQSIDITLTPTSSTSLDSSLYVIESCSDVNGTTCAVGADDTVSGSAEEVAYTNTSGSDATITIVADAFSGCGDITLEVE